MGSATSSRGTLRSNTIDIIRVGRQHTFSRALVLLTFCACTELSAGESTTAPLNAAHSWPRGLDFKRCLGATARMPLRRPTLLQQHAEAVVYPNPLGHVPAQL